MALIACEECKRGISSRAGACPHCGCPITLVQVAQAGAEDPVRNQIPELKVSVAMPPGLGTATASAIKSVASSKVWGRLYQTVRAAAGLWLAACLVFAAVLYYGRTAPPATSVRNVVYDRQTMQPVVGSPKALAAGIASGKYAFDASASVSLKGENGLEQLSADEAVQKLASGEYSLPTPEEEAAYAVETEERKRREDAYQALAVVGSGLAPLAILVALHRWSRWLKASAR